MKAEVVEINMELLGAAFARADSNEQVAFFKGLAYELKRFDSYYHKEAQFAYVASELTLDEKKQLQVLEILWYEEVE